MIDSRFNYLERPIQSPGSCAVCRGHGPVIDYMVNVPILGRLYICIDCLEGGLSNKPLSDEAIAERNYEAEIASLEELVEEYRGVVSRIGGILDNWISPPDSSGLDFDSSLNSDEQGTATEDSESAGKKPVDSRKQKSDGVSSSSINVAGLLD